ncbi:porin [Paraburkholderia flagellata]|uniref:porin n=1 Tax=Paraburkholderia flagellata TaxID=2883241 RepID=UPI001F34830C|nr:porin [Paraburkholderia flagellata]
MQKKVIAGTILTTLFTSGAHAQSSVTLYGIVDAAVAYTSNIGGHSAVQLLPGGMSSDRWGLLGKEDLGGGNHAVFKLENGFSVTNGALGQGGRMFGRNAYVGLANDQWGTLTAGRQYTPFQDFMPYVMGARFMTGYTLRPYDNDGLNNTFRANNSVKYLSPKIAGLSAEALYGFSNAPGQFANNRMWSVGADYTRGPLQLDAGYIYMNHPGSGTAGTAASDSYYGALPTIAAGGVQRQEVYGGGAAYTVGSFVATAMYTHSKFDALTGGSLTFSNVDVGLNYKPTPATSLTAGYIYTNQRSTVAAGANTHYNQLAGVADYYLSKTTDLYASVTYQKAAGHSHAFINGIQGASTSNNQTIVLTGIRKMF